MAGPDEPKKDGDSESPSTLALLKSMGAATLVVTGFAFVNGWLYWAVYFNAFGLNPLLLDFPTSIVSVSCFWVILKDLASAHGWTLFALIIGLVFYGVIATAFVYFYAHRHRFAIPLLVCLCIFMPVGALVLSQHDVRRDAGCQSMLPNITFQLIADPDPDDPPQPCTFPEYCKLIAHVGNVYHYFQPSKVCSDITQGSFLSGDLLESQIRAVTIIRPLGF